MLCINPLNKYYFVLGSLASLQSSINRNCCWIKVCKSSDSVN